MEAQTQPPVAIGERAPMACNLTRSKNSSNVGDRDPTSHAKATGAADDCPRTSFLRFTDGYSS
jgi:hypothetical protein